MTNPIKTALISVSNKEGIIDFAAGLAKLGIKIISTGGTAKAMQEKNIPVTLASEITGFPEIMDGRVKTLHPKIHAGILGKRNTHQEEADKHNIKWIDMVVCNLYPFAETIKKDSSLDNALKQIDIGGPSMIRGAAKNFQDVVVVVSPKDYAPILEALEKERNLNQEQRQQLSAKAFAHTAQYDALITDYLDKNEEPSEELTLPYKKLQTLRYGENPHQKAYVYKSIKNFGYSILDAEKIQGKELSYNNLVDADACIGCVKEVKNPACVVVKHTNPCGVAEHEDINQAFKLAWDADSLSAFGSVIAINKTCTKEIAEHISSVFVELIIAPDFTDDALKIFQQKPNLRVMKLENLAASSVGMQERSIVGGLLLQSYDEYELTSNDLQIVTEQKPSDEALNDMLFAWKVVKHVKSNAIVIAKSRVTLGVGPGQTSRVGSVEIALGKAKDKMANSVLASDAFFPFRDNIDAIAKSEIRAIIQPGGSVRDDEVIAACNEHKIAMVFTEKRCFKH